MIKKQIEFIGQKDKKKRFENICSLIKGNYIIQSNNDIKNIIIPAKTKKKIVLTAHYDVYPDSHGYNDNAAGIVSLLNIHSKVPNNVEIVFTDKEEVGGVGSSFYIEKYKNDILYNINIDVIGLGENIFYDIYSDKKNIIKHGLDKSKWLRVPFSDSHIFNVYQIPSIILISGSTSINQIISEIWNAQHGGKNDNKMEFICEKGISNISDLIMKIIK